MLQVTYQSTGNIAVQDAIGQCVLNVARVVPDGMLVFFSSYSLLDRLTQRWQVGALRMHCYPDYLRNKCSDTSHCAFCDPSWPVIFFDKQAG